MERTRLNFDDSAAEIIELSGQVLTITIHKFEKWNPSVSFSWRNSIDEYNAGFSTFTFYENEVKQRFNALIEALY